MPEEKYSYIPTQGNFDGVRSFGEQVKHVACAQFAFFNEIEGKTPPEHCEKGGPSKAKTKAELLQYLRDSFEYGDKVLATITSQNAVDRVEGPYAGPNTKLGMAMAALWHVTDHFGQLVVYLNERDCAAGDAAIPAEGAVTPGLTITAATDWTLRSFAALRMTIRGCRCWRHRGVEIQHKKKPTTRKSIVVATLQSLSCAILGFDGMIRVGAEREPRMPRVPTRPALPPQGLLTGSPQFLRRCGC